jgi:RNA 2',3'-cyclic 3'-phosphodiesterase
MRTFIAIELPQEIKDSLSKLQDELKAHGADVKWVEPKNIHLTLKFLGEIDNKQSEKISEIISRVARDNNSFQAAISSLGAFPKIDHPRVIWAGIDAGDKELKIIAERLEDEISLLGIPKEERAFSSHITIARVRSPSNRDKLVQDLKTKTELDGKKLEFSVTKITLFKSTLTPKGPLYEPLKETSLKTT